MLFALFEAGAHSPLVRQALLPVDLAAFPVPRVSRSPPLTNLEPRRLLERLVEEYFFAELARAAMESFASENGAWLATMQSARENVERSLDELEGAERRLRQEQITAEILKFVRGRDRPCGSRQPIGPAGGLLLATDPSGERWSDRSTERSISVRPLGVRPRSGYCRLVKIGAGKRRHTPREKESKSFR